MRGYVYILKNLKNGRYYVGCSAKPDERLLYHNFGKVKSTRFLVPWERVYLSQFETMTEARKEECRIKSMKSKKFIEELLVRAVR